ncbi:MAG: hypothetical protein HY063_02435 [Bacteroidetes bacterium]|nr:hypothetical protein [Bacteroidota bacterium]
MDYVWDYQIKKNWRPRSDAEWIWFLERKINYHNWKGIRAEDIAKYFTRLKLEPGVKLMLQAYFKLYGKKKKIRTG